MQEKSIKLLMLFSCLFIRRSKLDTSNYNSLDDFLKMVIGNITATERHVLLSNNSNLLTVTDNDFIYDFGKFDFIIVGSGAAGAVLANRLSEIKSWKILLLEAGGNDNDMTDIVGLNSYPMKSDINWGYQTIPQANAGLNASNQAQPMNYARGKVRGGSTTINGGNYVRGNREDFDKWELLGWSYEDVLPYFKKSENAKFPGYEKEYHGTGGYLDVDYVSDIPGLSHLIPNAFKDLGQEELADFNGEKQLGIAKPQLNINYNQRHSSSRAFLDPIMGRSNLNISLNSFVTKILIKNQTKTAYGVEFVKNNKRYKAFSKKEVIVSGGAINSPQLLMLSGIGPREHLEELGIDVIADLPVGENITDHLYFTLEPYRTNFTFFNITYRKLAELYYLENKRPWTATYDYLSFIKTNESSSEKRPNIEFLVGVVAPPYETYFDSNGTFQKYSTSFGSHNAIMITTALLHPKSRGTIKLHSNDPVDFPIVDPNYFGDPDDQDIETVYQALLYIMKLNNTKTFMDNDVHFSIGNILPCDTQFDIRYSKDWCYCVIKRLAAPGLHVVSSTPMGVSPNNSVVDLNLRIHNMKKIRVIDAGVMPHLNSGHTAAPTMMIAEKASDIIKQDYGKK